jgi:hypothetical protein
MTYDDSFQIAGTSLPPRPVLARWWRGERASGVETIGNVVFSGRRRTQGARKPVSSSRPAAKFSALQSFENAQNAEEISNLPEPVPEAGGPPDGVPTSLGGIESTGRRVAEKGAQGLELARCRNEIAARALLVIAIEAKQPGAAVTRPLGLLRRFAQDESGPGWTRGFFEPARVCGVRKRA